jgi:hypothetical protein
MVRSKWYKTWANIKSILFCRIYLSCQTPYI